MKLNFRQGIVRARTTAQGTPDFLSLNQGSGIQINITNPTLLITLAHKDTNFLIEEVATAINGWGPFSWSSVWGSQPSTPIYHLYWDVNLATGEVTRGYTHSAPIVSSTNPLALLKVVGTHWFDLSTNVMKVSDGTFWVPVCRVFAGTYSPNVQSIKFSGTTQYNGFATIKFAPQNPFVSGFAGGNGRNNNGRFIEETAMT